MNLPRLLTSVVLSGFVVGTPYSVLSAQEVQWRHDYNAARREAQETGRPLLLDFGTTNCFWCRKLDATTFRDPGIVAALNQRFVPLKVDAGRDAPLANALGVQAFPTLVFAAPDGRLLGSHPGYVDVAPFHELLVRVLGMLGNPDWMARDYQEAARALADFDYARAVALLRRITEDAQDRPVQHQARQLLQEIEQQAAGRLAQARQLGDRGQTAEAIASLLELLRTFGGTRAAAEGGPLLLSLAARPETKAQSRARRAQVLLTQAREEFRARQFLCCLDRCENLAANYADLLEGAEAVQIARELKGNPDCLKQTCDRLGEQLGALYMELAETWLQRGQPQQAVPYLERVVQLLPGSRQAEAAQARLARLGAGSNAQPR
jgi:thioredoxin-related protein